MTTESEEALIARLLDLPLVERADYLRRLCANQPDLGERTDLMVRALSSSDRAAQNGMLPSTDGDRARVLALAFVAEESAATAIGPYKLLQKIGEGGFGVVWMAEQQVPVRRQVALKVIKRGMDTREVIARFEAERQALALMDHPNIARVLDAGATERGQPYFVMELVRGIPITTYCDSHRLSTGARLHLFIAVCHAVQHAHQKGVIHRDLKPSNIIVTLHDGVAVPKIIDFGIAKATQGRLTDKTLFTQFHAFLGTPAYTSPEQMEMSGLDVDTRSDIYSLGILLYELLAGRPPFDPDELLRSGLEEMRRTIREVDPPRPSHRLRTLTQELRATVAQQRNTDAAKLSMLLRGDLDWIVMHCLEKDRTRRYETAGDLASDVRRYMNDEPVVARPPNATYRLGKFIRRHKLGFASGSAILVSILAGLVVSSLLLVREHAARERAVAAEMKEGRLRREAEAGHARESALRQQADANASQTRIAAANSEQVAQFMKEMLGGVGPGVARGRDTTLLREVLDSTMKRLDTELRNQPEVGADLRDTLGMVYFDLGQYASAENLLRDAVAVRRSLFGNDNAQLAASLDKLGVVLTSLNKFAEAETLLGESLAISRRLHGNEHVAVATTLYHLANVWSRQGKFAESQSLHREVLTLRRKLLGDEHPDVAASIASLGSYEESLAMRRRLLGNEHPDVAESLVGLGNEALGPEAIEAYREAFTIRRKLYGDGHPQVIVTLLRFLSALAFTSTLEEAVPTAREIVASTRKNLGNDSIVLAPALLALASMLHGEAKYTAEVQALVDEAHALFQKSRASGSPVDSETFLAMREFVTGMFLSGQPERGVEMCREMVMTARSVYGAENALTVDALRPLAWTLFFSGHILEARRVFEEVVVGMRKLKGPRFGMSLVLLSGLAASHRELGDYAKARRVIDEGLALLENTGGKNGTPDPAVATVLFELGLVLNHEMKFVEAERVFREAIGQNERSKPGVIYQRFRPRAEPKGGLGLALAGQGRFEEGESLVVGALLELQAGESALGGDRRKILGDARERVVQFYRAWGKAEKAAEWTAKPSTRVVGPAAPPP